MEDASRVRFHNGQGEILSVTTREFRSRVEDHPAPRRTQIAKMLTEAIPNDERRRLGCLADFCANNGHVGSAALRDDYFFFVVQSAATHRGLSEDELIRQISQAKTAVGFVLNITQTGH